MTNQEFFKCVLQDCTFPGKSVELFWLLRQNSYVSVEEKNAHDGQLLILVHKPFTIQKQTYKKGKKYWMKMKFWGFTYDRK